MPPFRKRRVGTQMLQALEVFARSVTARCLWLETQNVNYPAIAFYRAAGFTFCGFDSSLYDPQRLASEEVALFFARSVGVARSGQADPVEPVFQKRSFSMKNTNDLLAKTPCDQVSLAFRLRACQTRFLCSVLLLTSVFLLPGLISGRPAFGTEVAPMTIEETIHDAGAIFVGTVQSEQTHWGNASHRWMYTEYTFNVEEAPLSDGVVQKGGQVTISYWGGTIGNQTQRIADVEIPKVGQRYVIMLRPDWQTPGYTPIVGLHLGQFQVQVDAQSKAQYVTESDGRPLFTAAQAPQMLRQRDIGNKEATPRVTLANFTQWIRANLARIKAMPGKPMPQADPKDPRVMKTFSKTPEAETTALDPASEIFGEPISEPQTPPQNDQARIPTVTKNQIESKPTREPVSVSRADQMGPKPFYVTYGYTDPPIVVNSFPHNWYWYPEDQYQMSKWNYYSNDLFRVYTNPTGNFAWGNGRFDLDGWPDNATMQSQYGYTWGSNTLGITFANSNGGHFSEADIALNPAFSWTLDDEWCWASGPAQSFRATMLHELGHMFGLDHDFNYLSIMNYAPSAFRAYAIPYADDAEGARALYPGRAIGRSDLAIYLFYSVGYQNWTDANYPSSVDAGAYMNINHFHIENTGTATINNPSIQWYLTTSLNYSDPYYYLGTTNYNGSIARFSYWDPNSLSLNLSVPTYVPGGNYYLNAYIPNDDGASNFPFANNYGWSRFQITVQPAPTLSSITPTSVYAGLSSFYLDVYGTNFQPGAAILWNGSYRGTTYLSSTHLYAYISDSDIANEGSVSISVQNPSGVTTGTATLTIYAPVLDSISPDSALTGSQTFTMDVYGAGFDSSAVVNIGSFLYLPLPTTYLSSTHLQATVDAAWVAAPGSWEIFVSNPSGASTNVADLYVDDPSVGGTLTLQGIASGAVAQNISFEFRPTDGSDPFTKTASVAPDGNFSLGSVPAKEYTVHVKGAKYLASNVTINMIGENASLNASLAPGDANNDNACDTIDFGILVGAYGGDASIVGSGYDANCDFNGDGLSRREQNPEGLWAKRGEQNPCVNFHGKSKRDAEFETAHSQPAPRLATGVRRILNEETAGNMLSGKHYRITLFAALALCGLLLGFAAFGQGENRLLIKPDFVRDIQPIFKARCYACHAGTQKQGGLRLDTRAFAMQGGAGGRAFAPGSSVKSLMLTRLTGQDGKPRMPLGFAPLSEKQTALIRAWVDAGAAWPESGLVSRHWAYIPPSRPAVPKVKNTAWVRNPIDVFTLARMERVGLQPSPEADKITLLRRVTLDLTGLPPTPQEVDAFLADRSPTAYEKVVTRLLNSPHYGERMALPWLDAARYADSNGFQQDGDTYQYVWRDWVTRALNANMPFSQFTILQLAGDLLPNATPDQQLATAFNRCHMLNGEGGAIPEEQRHVILFDRVDVTATVWLGATMACAQCHDHKYDPITQRDYYSFMAFFNNAPESGTPPGGGQYRIADPWIFVGSEAETAKLKAFEAQVVTAQDETGNYEREHEAEIQSAQALWEADSLKNNSAILRFDAAYDTAFEAEKQVDLAKTYLDGKLKWVAHPEWEDGKPYVLNGENTATYLTRILHSDRETLLTLSLGSDDAIKVWLNGESALANKVTRAVAPDQERVTVRLHSGENCLLIKIVNGGGIGGFYFKAVGAGLPENVLAIMKTRPEMRSEGAAKQLRAYFLANAPPAAFKALREKQKLLEIERDNYRVTLPKVMVMSDAMPRKTHLLQRGNYEMTGEETPPATPAFLPPMPQGAPRNRLGLAQWLMRPDNPLTARVQVNRYWQLFFGVGLVKTSENMGTQSDPPTHPLLLDWLAAEFRESGWNVKRMHRLIVTSATYRQSSKVTPSLLLRDPENRLLARGARFRLPSLLLRDVALAASGLLDRRIGGKPVYPYQPKDIWDGLSITKERDFTYPQSTGSDLYRRSLYTFWRRTVAPSNMFDASFFGSAATSVGIAALAGLLQQEGFAAETKTASNMPPLPGLPHFAPKAKRVIVLWQGGAPSHVDLFDYKPGLFEKRGQQVPDSVRAGARLSTMTAGQKNHPVLPPIKPFKQYGKSGMWLSEMLPHIGSIADDICLVKTMRTDSVNHAPGVAFFLTGSQTPGRPSMGAWATYGLGSIASDLPAFCVMTSTDVGRTCGQLFYDYYWGSGFLPSEVSGRPLPRPAFRNYWTFQKEPPHILEMYGPDVQRKGSYARNCLLARRLIERGVRFVQLMHSGWDQHSNLSTQLEAQCRDTDQPSAALVADLKQRGLLDDTIVLWGGEFGRTVFVQGDINNPSGHGRDHLGSCYSMWLAGGGFKGGMTYGETDDYCYNVAKDPVHIHDLQATLLRQLGIDHTRLTYRYQGRDFRLTDVFGSVVKPLIA
ncbi:uncharacterized protein KY384_000095 [Bacidia gigantensis]|uniref:uncharacterized protein n=1 Tax=Bacidia gigantensis TaxID=2732470 RepID=UPI001D056CB5|nr:uncharacterized protein KY384_000095 [Bacidia gigantensis]KAG8526102.1 hypothetical protein KY384_000095 [Bacidia gigantensis]